MKKFSLLSIVTALACLAGTAQAELPASVQTSITSLQADVVSMVGMVVVAVLAVVASGLGIYAILLVIRKAKRGLSSSS